jgi:putative radical SAM enzyme (TIGR03279 family)
LECKGIIANIMPNSIASEAGLAAGDKLLTVNGQAVRDLIDLSFALAEENVSLLVEKAAGEQEVLVIAKEYDEKLGMEFESAVFDGVRQCANRCVFCFVDQMPSGMRDSLYIKDDDYRLSFLYGNFITLTNSVPADMQRIKRLHLSPLYISVHTTVAKLRQKMLNNPNAGKILAQLKDLAASGIDIHTQVVLCPTINDGEALNRTFADLYALYPQVQSLAIVPVGLTRYRDHCPELAGFLPEQAAGVIATVRAWQTKCRQETGQSFVYLADEFYLLAGIAVPEYDFYDGFPQLENGIGIVRNFLAEWAACKPLIDSPAKPEWIDVVCGVSTASILQPLLRDILVSNMHIRLVPVKNYFFGSGVTVTGLLTGQDIIKSLQSLSGPRTGIVIPGIALRKGEAVFLDNQAPDAVSQACGVPVRIAYFAADLKRLLYAWR